MRGILHMLYAALTERDSNGWTGHTVAISGGMRTPHQPCAPPNDQLLRNNATPNARERRVQRTWHERYGTQIHTQFIQASECAGAQHT